MEVNVIGLIVEVGEDLVGVRARNGTLHLVDRDEFQVPPAVGRLVEIKVHKPPTGTASNASWVAARSSYD